MGCGPSKQQAQQVEKPQHGKPPSPSVAVAGSLSPIYRTLPPGAQKFPVRNVYDGDTLTLVDERRVRFLGIDTPELKEKQPYAEEAKEYTKSHCPKKQGIWLVIDGTDHYGRLLAHIFVEVNGGYLCVNEGLVEQGFAFAYIPNQNDKTFNWNKLIQLQARARKSKRGVWKSFQDSKVFATKNGAAYHQRNCTYVSQSKNLRHLLISQATDEGLHPCRKCMA